MVQKQWVSLTGDLNADARKTAELAGIDSRFNTKQKDVPAAQTTRDGAMLIGITSWRQRNDGVSWDQPRFEEHDTSIEKTEIVCGL